jgi:DNA-binding transcriptional ArsR family regulator
MDSVSAIYSKICLHPMTISELNENLPYSRESIYKSIHELYSLGLIEKVKQGRTNLILPSRGYRSKRMQDLFLKALESDIDPKFLLEDSFIAVLKISEGPTSLSQLCDQSGLSYHKSRRVLFFMEEWGLIKILKRKPYTYEINEAIELISLMHEILGLKKMDSKDITRKRILDGKIGLKIR